MSGKPSRREVLVGACGVTTVALGLPFGWNVFAHRDPTAKVVAGSENDFLIARYLRLDGSNFEIGGALAAQAKRQHKTKLGKLDRDRAKARTDWFAKHYPAMLERAKGAAKEYGCDWKTTDLDVFGLGYDLMDQPGCSTVYYPDSKNATGHSILSRNYDFSTRTLAEIVGQERKRNDRAFTADPYILELHPKDGYASLALVSYDLLCGCIDGMNERGLSVALLADDVSSGASPTHGAQVGLGEIEITRFLLDTCGTVEEVMKAVKGLQHYYSFIPCHYLVGDAAGNSCVLEWTIPGDELKVTRRHGETTIVTNHLVHDYPDRKKFPNEPWPAGTFNRYCKLQDQIDSGGGKPSLDQIKAFNQAVQAGPHMGPPQAVEDPRPGRTLWHSVYDLKQKSLQVSFYLGESKQARNGQRRTEYLEFQLK